uniref:DM2 domain-containing protein n=1 Tax=viral metagenome TaxID=1070528 RepID=A0A6C0HH52_9ZZZZ
MSTEDKILHIKYQDIKLKFNDLNLDELRMICRENGITGFSTLNKQALIDLIYVDYDTNYTNIRMFSYTELLEKCKKHKLLADTCSRISKDLLIHIVISALYIKNKVIKHPVIMDKELKPSMVETIIKQLVKDLAEKKTPTKNVKSSLTDYLANQFKSVVVKPSKTPKTPKKPIGGFGFIQPNLISDELAMFLGKPIGTLMSRSDVTREINVYIRTNDLQDKVDGRKINADMKLSTLLKLKGDEEFTYFNLQRFISQHFISNFDDEIATAVPVPVPVSVSAPPVPVPALSALSVSVPALPVPVSFAEPVLDVDSQTQRRRPLPTSVRDCVWNHYIGEDINKHRCLCCKKVVINNRQFQVGHVISVRDGGTDEINNLRPICAPCNHSMGTKNMIEFVKTYGYYIG